MSKPKTIINWKFSRNKSTAALPSLVAKLLTEAVQSFGKTRASVRSVRGNFVTLLSKTMRAVNESRKAADLATLTMYDVLKSVTGGKSAEYDVTIHRDDLYAFGRQVARTVDFRKAFGDEDLTACLNICAIDFVSNEKNTYMSIADLDAETHEVEKLEEGEVPAIEDEADDVPEIGAAANA